MPIEREASPLEVKSVAKVFPSYVSGRIAAQAGVFTVHPSPSEPFDHPGIMRLRVPVEQRAAIRRELNTLGINRANLFPDIDGLAAHIMWLRTDGD